MKELSKCQSRKDNNGGGKVDDDSETVEQSATSQAFNSITSSTGGADGSYVAGDSDGSASDSRTKYSTMMSSPMHAFDRRDSQPHHRQHHRDSQPQHHRDSQPQHHQYSSIMSNSLEIAVGGDTSSTSSIVAIGGVQSANENLTNPGSSFKAASQTPALAPTSKTLTSAPTPTSKTITATPAPTSKTLTPTPANTVAKPPAKNSAGRPPTNTSSAQRSSVHSATSIAVMANSAYSDDGGGSSEDHNEDEDVRRASGVGRGGEFWDFT